MKSFLTILGLLSFSYTVFAAPPTCPQIRKLLVTSKNQLENEIRSSRTLAKNKRQQERKNLSLQRSLKTAEKALFLVRESYSCISVEKSEDLEFHEKYQQLQELSYELQTSQNPAILRAVELRTEILFILEILN